MRRRKGRDEKETEKRERVRVEGRRRRDGVGEWVEGRRLADESFLDTIDRTVESGRRVLYVCIQEDGGGKRKMERQKGLGGKPQCMYVCICGTGGKVEGIKAFGRWTLGKFIRHGPVLTYSEYNLCVHVYRCICIHVRICL